MTVRAVGVTLSRVTVHHTVTVTVTASIRFGAYVAVTGVNCSPDPERTGTGGIAKRPQGAGTRESYPTGENVIVLTDGGVLADLADGQRWVEVAAGCLINPG